MIGAGSVGMPYTTGPFGANWTLLGLHVRQLITPYNYDTARRRTLAAGYPDERYLKTLRNPPTPDEIIADAETRLFSD